MTPALNVPLPEYLRAAALRPFGPGRCDCVLFACDWVAAATGVDPAAPWRGRYATARGAARIIARAGGLAALVAGGMARAGIPATDDPLTGDIAMIRAGNDDLMAIRTPLGWAVKTAAGVACVMAAPIAAWSVPWPRP